MTKPESGPPAPKPVASSNGTVTAASSSSSSSSSGGALRWTKVETVAARGSGGGDVPTRRSGHSLSVVGSNGFLFGGCDHREPPGPTNDLFVLRIGAQAPWEWEKLRSPPGTAPPPRWKHSATVVDGKVFIFGGFQSSTARLNDLWVFNPITMDWSQPADKSGAGVAPGAASLSAAGAPHRTSVAATRASSAVVPAPRGGHSAVAIRKCIYVFGGYGGAGYGRRDFDDLHVLRCDDASWSKVASKGRAPEKRAGHQACAVDDVMVVCGGWNSVAQFNDLHVFDTRTGAWAAVEGPQMATPLPRWNHAACAVAAIPHAKVFTFGGVLGEPGNYNGQGTFANDIAVLDSGDMSWTSPEVRGAPPCGRSDTTLAYDDKGSRLLLFGGWANAWLNDLYCLDVSCVVGPPYGVTGVFPAFGPSTGGTALVLDGIDFVNKPVTVRFACRQGAVDVPGEFVDDHTLHVTTPDFTAFPPGDVQVRIALLGDSFTTTFQTFAFFAVTHASLCFAYGPGVLCGGASGEPTSFIIQARDAARGLRTRGSDVFTVEVVAAAGGGPLFLPTLTIQDLMNGRYLVSYTVQAAGEYAVHVAFQGTFGGAAGPIRKSPHVVSFDDTVTREMNLLTGKLVLDQVLQDLQALQQASRDCNVGLEQPLSDPSWTPEQTTNALIALKAHVFHVEKRGEDTALSLDELRAELAFLEDAGLAVAKERETLGAIELAWLEIQRKVPAASARIAPLIAAQSLAFRAEMDGYGAELQRREAQLKAKGFWSFAVGATAALDAIAAERAAFEAEDAAAARKRHIAEILECSELLEPCDKALSAARRTLEHAQQLWDAIADVARKLELAQDVPWSLIDGAALEEEAKAFLALVKGVHKEARDCDAYRHFERLVRDFLSTCPLFQALRHPAMRRRHWQELAAATGRAVACLDDTPALKFADVLALRLHECQRDVEEIADRAQKEAKQEAALQDLEARWAAASFAMARHAETGTPLLRLAEDTVEMLEADQLLLQAMAVSPTHFQAQTQRWCSALVVVADVAAALSEIQRAWAYLEPLFMRSDEVARELPDEAARFAEIDARVQQTLQLMWSQRASGNVLLACALPDLLQSLSDLRARLEASQQALKEYLDAKRRLFPRFYFVSEADLLDLLSTGSRPASILVHLEKLFLATRTLVLEKGAASVSSSSGAMTTTTTMLATHFVSNDAASERIPFEHALALSGKVELYLQVLLDAMQHTLREHVARSVRRFPEQHRAEWLLQKLPAGSSGGSDAALAPMDAAQAALLVAGVEFANSVENAFVLLASGRATAMTELHDKVVAQLTDLVRLTQTPLSRPDRQRVMSLITADAHARDVVQKLLYENTTAPSSFLWQAQLKQRRAAHANRTYLEICDATFEYGFEYLGNGPRLVVTPLTDRIYVTATQALHMQMGCAPAGPAGTGKTETTKDLASALGKACYVFNCSPEMDYKNLGNIFKGLASAGAWGCFDEFNRLAPDVLSVCSVQFKAVCDAVRADSDTVTIEGDCVRLDASCGTFVTMNPGYLGRSELPEGLKALFRPITVMAPDLVLICENMLMAEGFRDAKLLAAKFDSLYALLRELLSRQDHYDWGLRAVKSVLVVAGAFKRAEPKLGEHEVLLRSLRDFNLPKLAAQDLPVFRGLLEDLFPGLDPPRRVDEALETFVHAACEERGLWPHEPFRLKVVQLEELLAIRHCVFVMGSPGSGKTECCETLVAARRRQGDAHHTKVVAVNPKTVSTEELYGCMALGSREWKDGLLAKLMRDAAAASASDPRPKWLVLDGDLDANWIESMNSVMDDNKMLTLASNERIPLKPNMRLLFEIRDLQFATPATVSRAGILYLASADGAQWRAFLASWVSTKGATLAQRAALGEAVTRYTEPSIAFVRDHCKTVVPMEDIALVQTYLYFLDALLDAEALADPKRVDVLSGFIAVWAFGAALTVTDDGTDYRKVFSEWWRAEFKHLKFPTRDTVFDYWLNPATLGFDLWRASPHFRPVRFDGSVAMSAVTVPTPETAAITNWMSLMVREARPFMLCGGAGTGKTQLVQGVLASIDSFAAARPLKGPAAGSAAAASSSLSSTRSCSVLSINFNYYTSASALQLILESKLSKRVGATFGPSAGGQLVYFLDDLNLPQVDAYNTQSALALLRQYLDYGLWYDRARFAAKQIQDVQLLSCMNPGAGSFVVNPRLQRHFVTFALAQPSPASLQVIYATFLEGYVADFVEDIRKLAGPVLKAALGLHAQVSAAFRKTAANFHYEFNLRHVANVVQGLLMARPATFEDPVKFALLWVHESARVYGDRLVTASDLRKFTALVHQQARRCFPSFNFTRYFVPPSLPSPEPSGGGGGALAPSDPILFAHIANGLRANEYDQVVSLASLQGVVEEALSEYNDALPRMALVLFRDALEHVVRIVRILSNPSGHAMLVGVGGSGRKSLARLAVFVCGLALVEVAPTHAYSLLDFKTDLQSMVTKAGVRGEGLVFLFSDSQITHERMLVPLNDLLSSGSIPDLFTADEQANLVQQVLPRANAALAAAGTAGVTAAGDVPEKERCWRWVVHETKRNLHVVLCFSPATAAFRLRARRFPALVNCTLIDWFQPWPSDALHSVAARFLSPDSDPVLAACVRDSSGGDALVAVVQSFMPFAFESTNALAADFLRLEQRRVYATPKSFLECLTLFRELLARKHAGHERATLRLESGLEKMKATSHVVATMELELARTLAEAEAKRALAEELAARLRTDKEVVERETAKANSERETCALIQADVAAKKADTEADLAQAQPMVDAAMAALDTLSKKDLGSCKTMSKPPAGVGDVFGAVVVLFAGVNANVVVQKSGKVKDKDRAWEASKKALLGNINAFVDELKGFKAAVDEQRVPETNWREVRPFLQLEHFSVESIEKKNSAAAGLCAWVINIVAYYDAIVVVEPKKAALAAATDRLRAANDTLARVNARLGALEAQLALLSDEFARTSQAVQDAVAAVERGRLRIELATRLTAALGSESVRWTRELAALRERAGTLVCDVLVAASFVSYIGAFTKPFRDVLLADRWVPFLRQALAARKDAPSGLLADRCHPLEVLASDAEVAEWTARGLPSDRVSVENAAIARCSRRAPLLVDPQLQGIYWLREMEKHARRAHPSSFQVVRQDQPNLPQLLEAAVERGHAVLVENMAEAVEPCLWPLIARATTTRGLKTFLALGDRLVALHANFRLYLHTKLSNPHFPPELQAEAALVNFAVTQQGLEDQLLALVVRHEWPRKARARTALVLQQSEFTVRVQALEDRILSSLADAEGDVTENVQVIADLEATKATAVEIARKAAKAAEYEAQLRALAAKYQAVASRGALLFFLLDGLARLHTYYVFSLNAFVVIFQRGIDLEPNELAAQADDSSRPPSGGGGGLLSRLKAAAKKVLATQRFQWNADLLLADRVADSGGAELALEALLQQSDEDAMPSDAQIAARCAQLNERVTAVVFNYVRRGCFEKHKLALATQLCFAVLQAKRTMQSADVRQLVTAAPSTDPGGPGMGIVSEWLSDALWRRVRRLEESVASLQKLTTHIKSDADEWREWFEADAPEAKPLPGPYRVSATPLQRLHVVRVLRPDRTLAALEAFVAAQLGAAFTQQPPFDMEAAYLETSASTPMLFVLFPGVDPTAWVERLGRKFDITYERGKLVNISMGQGQEAAADRALLRFAREGSWVVLQNVHLMPAWLPTLERSLELYSVSADPNFRCFLSAEPPAAGALSNLPESLLQSCIKVANEAPTDLKSNLRRAWANFSLAHIAASARPREYQGCLFALCFFHALVLGRRRFGAQGWSRPYSFNTGDLLICADVLRRYLEHPPSKGGGSDNGSSTNDGTGHLPWDDLRYIFGEIMYGGHITDPWDRITSHAYLSSVFTPAVLTGAELAPGFKCPDPAAFTYAKYASYIETELPVEAPGVYGLHPNAEIGYLVDAADKLFFAIARFEPLASGGLGSAGSAGSTSSKDAAQVVTTIEALLERLPAELELTALQARAAPLLTLDRGPYVVVALQEAARMNGLVREVRDTLSELLKGLSGALSMTEPMEDLLEALMAGQVPGRNALHRCSWERVAWSSRKALGPWFADFVERAASLAAWAAEFRLPYSVWLAGLFNPAAFLTAIKQCTARQHGLALDAVAIETHCTTLRGADAAEAYPDRGAFVHGLFLEGARWEPPEKDGEPASPFAYEVDGVPCGGHVVDPAPKELFPATPVVYARAVAVAAQWEATGVGYFRRQRDVFDCPVYQTTQRGATYVFLATLHTVAPPHKWVLAGLALVMQRDDDS